MTGRQSSATECALGLVRLGHSVAGAARAAGIARSTLTRALLGCEWYRPKPRFSRRTKRVYREVLAGSDECAHCDGEHGRRTRRDFLRGIVCPSCDVVLDEMLAEGTAGPPVARPSAPRSGSAAAAPSARRAKSG